VTEIASWFGHTVVVMKTILAQLLWLRPTHCSPHWVVNSDNILSVQCKYLTTASRLVLLVHGQVTIIFVVSVCLFVCLFVQSFSQPSLIRFRSN